MQKHIFGAREHRLLNVMIYLDNAATSRFKPKCVMNALLFDLTHSANAGRSGHSESIAKTILIDDCRTFLISKLANTDEFDLVFTKNCTEALNLAIFGFLQAGDKVVTTKNEHNSVLRPLFKLKKDGLINLEIADTTDDGHIDYEDLEEKAKGAKLIAAGGACNVTGAVADVEKLGKTAKECGATLLLDGAQSVPIIDCDTSCADMIAIPAHKGLHGVQGVGALVVKKDVALKPLLYGGTGARSNELTPNVQMPESFEAGTQFTGGISALYQGAKWTYDNLSAIRKNTFRISKNLGTILKDANATIYTHDFETGVVSFNFSSVDSGFIADELNEYDVCVRSGLHCAPLVHERMGTATQGAVRASVGCDTTDNEINMFANILDKILRKIK